MATLPPESILPRTAAAPDSVAAHATLEADWLALHQQVGELARLARLAAEPELTAGSLGRLLVGARPWQINLLAQGIEDVAAMLGSGMAALATLSRRGQDTAAPALALWREFHAARGAMLAVLSAEETT